jgi:hypothetical protein
MAADCFSVPLGRCSSDGPVARGTRGRVVTRLKITVSHAVPLSHFQLLGFIDKFGFAYSRSHASITQHDCLLDNG